MPIRPVPIPDNLIWDGFTRRVIAPPDGDLLNPDIAPVEALTGADHLGGPLFALRIHVPADELEALAHDPHVWLFWHAHALAPFGIVGPAEAAAQ